MTSPARVRGGYEYKFVEEPPHGLKCVICLALVRQPQQHGECGKLFCMSCLTQHRQMSSKCPNCALQLNTFYDGKSDQEVKALKVLCTQSDKGCQWTGPLSSLNQHTQECDYSAVPCPNGCILNQETVHVCRKDLQDHLTNKCLQRQSKCPHCNEPGVYVERTTQHLETCQMVTVQCPHPECEVVVPLSELNQHKAECDYTVTICKFAKFGCKEKIARKYLKAHEEDDSLHLQRTKEKAVELVEQLEEQESRFSAQIEQQNKEIAYIRQSIRTSKKYTTPMYFKISKFSEYRHDNKPIYSPSFYTSQDGYRLIVELLPNGNGTGKNTHISLYVYLEKGDNDDSLSWPFKGTVTVKLLNQLEDTNHLSFNIPFPEDKEASGRVVTMEKSSGWGKPRLIANNKLGYDSKKKTQYLRGDTLFLHVDVHVPDYKPWLECTI